MSQHWSQRREGGGRFALWLIRTIGLNCGRGFSRLLLYPITLYFFLRRGRERHASRQFLRLATGRPASTWMVLRHIHHYAATILDRIFLLAHSTRNFDIRSEGLQPLHARIDAGRGVLLIGAHFGSFEVLRALADDRPQIAVRTVMDRKQTAIMTELLHALNPQAAACVINVGDDAMSSVLAIGEAAREGALIGFLGDRARPGEATVDVPFLGRPAAFPVAPYLIASSLQLPVMLCFSVYRGANRYDLYFEDFVDSLHIRREHRATELTALITRYASRLEHHARLSPYNWFNFYDFWDHPADGGVAADRVDRQPAT